MTDADLFFGCALFVALASGLTGAIAGRATIHFGAGLCCGVFLATWLYGVLS